MVRIFAILFGIGFIFAGVAGFLPAFAPGGFLFGVFLVDPMHNIVHLVSGVLAIMAATSSYYSRLYFQVFGVIYGLVTIAGFILRGDLGFLMMHMNLADNFLHLGITIVALFLGFATKKRGPEYRG